MGATVFDLGQEREYRAQRQRFHRGRAAWEEGQISLVIGIQHLEDERVRGEAAACLELVRYITGLLADGPGGGAA